MNVLAHRIASGARVDAAGFVAAQRRRVRVPREFRLLSASLLGTAGVMVVLQHLVERAGTGAS